MPTPTYTPLATVTLASATSSVTFSNIPATYRDLILVGAFTGSSASSLVQLTFNGDSNNRSRVAMSGGTGGASSGTATNLAFNAVYGSNLSDAIAQIMDYSATDKHKTVLVRVGNVGNSEVGANAGRWASTAAITSVRVAPNDGTFSSGSTFNLYGIVA